MKSHLIKKLALGMALAMTLQSIFVPTQTIAATTNNNIFTNPKVSVYPYLMNPEDYPAYEQRVSEVPTRDDFQNRLQLDFSVNGRGFVERLMDPPSLSGLSSFNRDNKWFYIRGGKFTRIPGIDNNEPGVESQDQVDSIVNVVGNRYLGKVVGEVDGGFRQFNHQINYPLSPNKMDRYYNFQQFINPFESASKGYLVTLHNVGGYHAWAKEGAVRMIGTQNFTRSQSTVPVQFAFARGAGKQNGLLWSGQYSSGHQFDDGIKDWSSDAKNASDIRKHQNIIAGIERKPRSQWNNRDKRRHARSLRFLDALTKASPERGVGISVYRNYLYSMYLYNSAYVKYERGGTISKKDPRLSPFGEMWRDANTFIENHKNPGVMQTPVAILSDFSDAFWRSPEIKKGVGRNYITWDGLAYDKGNWLMHNVFDMLHTGYRNANFFQNQRYEFPATPYGDIADVILSDAAPKILNQYNMVVAAGKLETDITGMKSKLEDYVKLQGGHFVVTGENAKKLFPEWRIGESSVNVPAGATIAFANNGQSENVRESKAGTLLTANALPANSRVVASYNNTPAVVEIPYGQGQVTLILSPYGLNEQPLPVNNMPTDTYWTEEVKFEYELLDHVKYVMDKKFDSQSFFNLNNDELRYIVNYRGPGEYTLGIINGTTGPQDFRIDSKIGNITSVRDLNLNDKNVEKELGFLPRGYHGKGGTTDANTVAGGGIKILELSINDGSNVDVLSKSVPTAPTSSDLYDLNFFTNVKREIMSQPDFFNQYSGVKITATRFLKTDFSQMTDDIRWLNDRQVKVVVDLGGSTDAAVISKVDAKLNLFKSSAKLLGESSAEAVRTTTGSVIAVDPLADKTANTANAKYFLNLRGKTDIREFLAENPKFFEEFGGVSVDASYVANRDRDAFVEEVNYLRQKNINVVVDFSSDIKAFDKISFIPQMGTYSRGMAMADNVFEKMQGASIYEAIVMTHFSSYANQKEGLKQFIQKAQARNIFVNIQNSSDRDNMQLNNLNTAIRNLASVGARNARIAINTITTETINSSWINYYAYKSGIIMIGTPGDATGTMALPLSASSPYEKLDENALRSSRLANHIKILNGEYQSWDEIERDLNMIK